MKNLTKKINDYLDYCENVKKMTFMSIKNKKNALDNFAIFVNFKRFELINNEDINSYIKYLSERGVSNNSINDYISRIIAMFKFHQDMGEKTSLKILLIPKLDEEPRRKNYYAKEIIYEVIENSSEMVSLMIRIGFDTGMRLSELTNLKLSDFEGKKIHYIGKGRKWHDTWIKEETYQKMKEYISDYAIKDYLWVEKDGTHIGSQTVAKYMKKAFKKNGIDDFHAHALRHSFATNLQKQGASVEEIQHMIGHLHLVTTEQYLHAFDKNKMCQLFEKYS